MARHIFITGGLIALVLSAAVFTLGVMVTNVAHTKEERSLMTVNEKFQSAAGIMMSTISPTAQAAVRTDHGLPMTNVPYRYSAYAFMLAIAVSNLYFKARNNRNYSY